MYFAARMLVCLLVMTAVEAPRCNAEVAVSLPLGGYYRPGRFVPVRVSGTGGGEVRIAAPGCVTTVVERGGEGEVVLPFLVVSDSVTALQVSGARPVEMKPVGEGQRLIVTVDAEVGTAKAVFPNEQLIGVPLDLNKPLLEPALAWSGVDAVVLSAERRLNDKQISMLLSGGVAIVVEGGQKPDGRWPWERVKDVWVLRHEVAGPREPVRAEAYSPTYAWDRGVPGIVRGQILVGAVVISILAVGLSMWRWKYATVAFVALCAVTVGSVGVAYLRGPRELTMSNTVIVTDERLAQVDEWTWYASLRESRMSCALNELTVPVFASGKQVERCEARLVCDGRGRPVSYGFRLGVNESLAFVTRSVAVATGTANEAGYKAPQTVWREFVSDLYVGAGDRLEGEWGYGEGMKAIYVSRAPRGKKAD